MTESPNRRVTSSAASNVACQNHFDRDNAARSAGPVSSDAAIGPSLRAAPVADAATSSAQRPKSSRRASAAASPRVRPRVSCHASIAVCMSRTARNDTIVTFAVVRAACDAVPPTPVNRVGATHQAFASAPNRPPHVCDSCPSNRRTSNCCDPRRSVRTASADLDLTPRTSSRSGQSSAPAPPHAGRP